MTLYDTFSQSQVDAADIDEVLANDRTGAVAIYTWNMHPDLAARAISKGCRGYLDKGMSAEELVDAIIAIADGGRWSHPVAVGCKHPHQAGPLTWPGRGRADRPRGRGVLALITQGLTNADIAARSYLSINSVKTYIRSAYRKIGVERRSQAVRWGLEHGMLPDVGRVVGL